MSKLKNLIKKYWIESIQHTQYRKRRKFRGVKVSWFLNCGLEVKFRGFRGSRFIHQVPSTEKYFSSCSLLGVFVDMVPSDNRTYRK